MINLGNEGCEAARELQVHAGEHFTALRNGVHEAMRRSMNQALDAEPAQVAMAMGYARAMRDTWMALETAALGLKSNQLEKPASEKRNAAAR